MGRESVEKKIETYQKLHSQYMTLTLKCEGAIEALMSLLKDEEQDGDDVAEQGQ